MTRGERYIGAREEKSDLVWEAPTETWARVRFAIACKQWPRVSLTYGVHFDEEIIV